MNLRSVEYFVAVVDHGGITKAAQALFVAQPSLSQAIRALERDLGVELFDRSGRRLSLTADGTAFLEPARRILIDLELAHDKVESVREGLTGRLEVAVLSTLAVEPLPRIVSSFLHQHPAIRVTVLDPATPVGLVESIRKGIAEVGLTELPLLLDGLIVQQLREQELVLVLPRAIAVDLPDPVPLAAIYAIPMVLEPASVGPHAALRAALGTSLPDPAVECVHRDAILALVEQGAGAAFWPRGIAEVELHDVVIRSTIPVVRLPVGIVYRPGPMSPAAHAFVEAALDTSGLPDHVAQAK